MSRLAGRAWAGALLLAMAGCLPSFSLNPFARPAPPQHVTPGSVDAVSARLQAALVEEGVAVLAKREGAGVRLAGSATSGKMFCLLLVPAGDKDNKRTAVSILWERGEDEQLRQIVLRALAPPAEDDLSVISQPALIQ
jgi:hypothetical protein